METAWRWAGRITARGWFVLILPSCAETSAFIDCHDPHRDPDACYSQEMADTERAAKNETACARGDPEACARHGRDLEGTFPVDAAEAYEFACAHSVATGCTRRGALLAARAANGSDRTRAVELETRGCVLGDATGCAGAAELEPDRAAGDRLAERACTLGGASCPRAGAARLKDDPKRAHELFATGCKAHVWESCIALGRMEATAP